MPSDLDIGRTLRFHTSYARLCLENGWSNPSLQEGPLGPEVRGWCLHGLPYVFKAPTHFLAHPTLIAQRFWNRQTRNCVDSEHLHGPFFSAFMASTKYAGFTYLGASRNNSWPFSYTIQARCSHGHAVHGVQVDEHSFFCFTLNAVVREVVIALRFDCEKKASYLPLITAAPPFLPSDLLPSAQGTVPTLAAAYAVLDTLTDLFPALKTTKRSCPAPFSPKCPSPPAKLALDRLVIHLNDDHKWSRERIADWLETLPVDLTIQAVSKGD